MMWHVVFAEQGRLPQSRAARSRDHAIQVACELLSQSFDVRRILEPSGRSIERAELNEHSILVDALACVVWISHGEWHQL